MFLYFTWISCQKNWSKLKFDKFHHFHKLQFLVHTLYHPKIMPYFWPMHVLSYKVCFSRCFHLSTFLSFFPPLCAVLKISDCEKYPLFALGQWELKWVCIDVLDSGRSPMLFFFFLFRKWKNFFLQTKYRQFFLVTWHFVCYWIQVI
jgi:hypothetical protein